MPAADRALLRTSPGLRNQVAAAAANRIASLAYLTPSERVVLLAFIVTPHSKAIAQVTGKRPNTVNNQLASAIHKLAAETREGLLIFLFTGEKPWLGENHYGLSRGATIG